MTKKRKLPQTGGQYERRKNGDPVAKPKPQPAKAVTPETEQPTSNKE